MGICVYDAYHNYSANGSLYFSFKKYLNDLFKNVNYKS